MANDKNFITKPTISLYNSIKEIQNKLSSSSFDAQYSGSTFLLLFLRSQTLFVLNVGDSRAVVGRKTVIKGWQSQALSKDHKPEILEEKIRLLKSGGRIEKLKDANGKECGPIRVWFSNENVYGLSMSRSMGDNLAKKYGVTWEPGNF